MADCWCVHRQTDTHTTRTLTPSIVHTHALIGRLLVSAELRSLPRSCARPVSHTHTLPAERCCAVPPVVCVRAASMGSKPLPPSVWSRVCVLAALPCPRAARACPHPWHDALRRARQAIRDVLVETVGGASTSPGVGVSVGVVLTAPPTVAGCGSD